MLYLSSPTHIHTTKLILARKLSQSQVDSMSSPLGRSWLAAVSLDFCLSTRWAIECSTHDLNFLWLWVMLPLCRWRQVVGCSLTLPSYMYIFILRQTKYWRKCTGALQMTQQWFCFYDYVYRWQCNRCRQQAGWKFVPGTIRIAALVTAPSATYLLKGLCSYPVLTLPALSCWDFLMSTVLFLITQINLQLKS